MQPLWLIVPVVVLLVVMVLFALQFRQLSRQRTEIGLLAERIAVLEQDLANQSLRLSAVQLVQNHALDDGATSLPDSQSDTSPYQQAIRMVTAGAGVEEIQRECGLARGEAELIVSLYHLPRHG
ncbi:DUF2802 domain-containing protein [Chitinilyticum piscinae]|uniref:DUF2802 domain-containing protein n=1 Tax=Chitinilyticum piscinae TaxID=2866724 RepID=A0A8J7FZZ3_9NEIS|nr:DUF2802 domain-containing protein [Chitinilyticum piscinae]MBE9608828.1 DUF2802 domain-containing protein [Chitinilyticum piscinae]